MDIRVFMEEVLRSGGLGDIVVSVFLLLILGIIALGAAAYFAFGMICGPGGIKEMIEARTAVAKTGKRTKEVF